MSLGATFVDVFFPLFIVVDPFGTMALFLTMTSDYSEIEKRTAAKDAFIYGSLILVFFTVAGYYVLSLMGISINAIEIAGGIILLIMGIEMVREGDRPKSTGKTFKNPDLGIVPFATPLLAGPGAISLVIILARKSYISMGYTIISVIIIFVVVLILFSFATPISKALGDKSMKAITRIFGLFVAAFAIQFMLTAAAALIG
ncbi:MAG: MarC family protein [Candidatus Thermoplasmatota archaeon]|jgi:multiple antibiotic resistance protein|nr:MarC family protein [Candidatus Thermoplasmatota archaeon]MCL6014482.1 MarC family protein [Candidatus Thermoplasmatota archaeon]